MLQETLTVADEICRNTWLFI